MKKIITFILILTFILSVCNFLPVLAEEQAVDETASNESAVLAEENENSKNAEESIDDVDTDTDQISQKELTDEEKEQLIFQYMEDTLYEKQNPTDSETAERKTRDIKWFAKSEHKTVMHGMRVTSLRVDEICSWIFEQSKKLYKTIVDNGVEISGVEDALNKGDKTYDNTSYLITLDNGDLKYVEGTNIIGDYGEVIGENGDIITPEFEQYANLYVFDGLENKYEIMLKNEYVSMSFDSIENDEIANIYYKLNNPQEIFDYYAKLESIDTNDDNLNVRKDKGVIDWDNNTYWNNNIDKEDSIKLIDELELEIDVTKELYHSVFQTISNIGETVKVTIKHIEPYREENPGYSPDHMNIITMSGSKGEVEGYSYIPLNGFYDSTVISLSPGRCIKDNILYTSSNNKEKWSVSFVGSGSDRNITGVKCNFFYYPVYEKDAGITYSVEGKNVKYTSYLDEEEWERNQNLYRLWTTNKDEYLEEKNKLFKEAEQKRKDAGIIVGTNKVLSMAKAEIDIDKTYAPAWYKNLGDNVSLILYGIAKEKPSSRDCMPMLRFQGDNGTLWFEWGSMRGYQDVSYEFEWNSLISFDGKNAVGSSSNCETLSGVMTFTDKYLDNFALTIGEETVNLTPDDFNIFGTDNLYHDDLIENLRIVDDKYWETVDDYMFIM